MNNPFSLKYELRSKLLDGLLPGAAFYLLIMMVKMAVVPVQMMFGAPGLLVLALSLMGIAMFSFQRALVLKFSETTRGWYGMAGGLLAWSVASITLGMDGLPTGGLSGVILLILGVLVLAQLWQQQLTTGGRFFLATLLLQWGSALVVNYLNWLAERLTVQVWVRQSWGWTAIAVAVLITAWMLVQSEERVQRTWAAVVVVTLLMAGVGLLY